MNIKANWKCFSVSPEITPALGASFGSSQLGGPLDAEPKSSRSKQKTFKPNWKRRVHLGLPSTEKLQWLRLRFFHQLRPSAMTFRTPGMDHSLSFRETLFLAILSHNQYLDSCQLSTWSAEVDLRIDSQQTWTPRLKLAVEALLALSGSSCSMCYNCLTVPANKHCLQFLRF